MRFYICVNHEGRVYKFVWINEDSKGIYLGMYGSFRGTHFSYHANGTRHVKLHGSQTPQLESEDRSTPINQIQTHQQIAFEVLDLSNWTPSTLGSEYQKEDRASSAAIFLDRAIFSDKTLAIDAYIFNRAKEQEFVDYVYSAAYNSKYQVLMCSIFVMRKFPEHKVGVLILSGQGVITRQ